MMMIRNIYRDILKCGWKAVVSSIHPEDTYNGAITILTYDPKYTYASTLTTHSSIYHESTKGNVRMYQLSPETEGYKWTKR